MKQYFKNYVLSQVRFASASTISSILPSLSLAKRRQVVAEVLLPRLSQETCAGASCILAETIKQTEIVSGQETFTVESEEKRDEMSPPELENMELSEADLWLSRYHASYGDISEHHRRLLLDKVCQLSDGSSAEEILVVVGLLRRIIDSFAFQFTAFEEQTSETLRSALLKALTTVKREGPDSQKGQRKYPMKNQF